MPSRFGEDNTIRVLHDPVTPDLRVWAGTTGDPVIMGCTELLLRARGGRLVRHLPENPWIKFVDGRYTIDFYEMLGAGGDSFADLAILRIVGALLFGAGEEIGTTLTLVDPADRAPVLAAIAEIMRS